MLRGLLAALLVSLWPAPVYAGVQAMDDRGKIVALESPARRIISLAPHVTELLYAAAAGDRVVGAVEYSDYPPPARALPRVGNAAGIDLERVLALRPDLVVAWRSGNPPGLLDHLESLGIPVYVTEPQHLAAIPNHIVHLGRLAGTESEAGRTADELRGRLAGLPQRVERPVRVFFQIAERPLMTVGGSHIISAALRHCGGENIFDELPAPAPIVDVEAVLAANPDVILASAPDAERWLEAWRQWPQLRAVHNGALHVLPEDWIARPGPRIVLGTELICDALRQARLVSGAVD